MAIDHQNISLLVLCGGMGSRMRGQDKPLLTYRGKAMVDHVIASAPGLPIWISANRNLEQYAERAPVFTDREVSSDIASPLNGLLGGLARCETDWLLVIPGDSPELPPSWWHPMADALEEAENGLVAHDGQRQQNLHLIIHRRTATLLRPYLKEGRGEVWRFLQQVRIEPFTVPHPEWFKNVNEVDDLA